MSGRGFSHLRENCLLNRERITITLWFPVQCAGHRQTLLCPQQAFVQSYMQRGWNKPTGSGSRSSFSTPVSFRWKLSLSLFSWIPFFPVLMLLQTQSERTYANFLVIWTLSFLKKGGRDHRGKTLFLSIASVSQKERRLCSGRQVR